MMARFFSLNRVCAVVAAAVVLTLNPLAQADDPKPSAPLPDGYKLVYAQDFDDASAMKDFTATDMKAWRFSDKGKGDKGGALELHGKSKYKPKVRSPYNIALIKDVVVGDFVLEADMLQTGREYGHRDMCLFFNYTDKDQFYYVHIATKADKNANNVFLVNKKPRTNIARKTNKGNDWGTEIWHRVRIERTVADGAIRVFFDDMKEPIMVAQDKHFTMGHVGFGSFDDTGKVDNIRLWAPESKKQAATFFK